MSRHDLAAVLERLDVIQRPGRFRFERAGATGSYTGAHAMITEQEGTTVIVEDPHGDWAWLTLSVETDLELVGLTAVVAPALAERGIPANVLAGLRHDHLLVPHDRALEAVDCLRSMNVDADGSPSPSPDDDVLAVQELTSAAGLIARLAHPAFAAVLSALHEAGDHGCTGRELIDAVDDHPKVVLGMCAALLDAGIVELRDGANRLTQQHPPHLATALRTAARGPLRVPRELAAYVDNGRLSHYPKNADALDALLRCVVEVVGGGTVHSERSLSQRLARIGDPADLRRRLVDRGLAERTATGSRYFVRPTT